MKSWLIHNATLVLLASVIGLLVMLSGAIPIKASSGHWPITKWLLSFSMSRSVSTHSTGIKAPANLNDPDIVMKGAGHFETGCAPCHGSPIWNKPRIAQGLLPVPPDLKYKVSEWTPEELFYIVKHGVKFTGMPAFPSQKRDDEVWDVVAFLLQFPDLDEAGYREMVFGDETTASVEVPPLVVQSCARCHGLDGMGRGGNAFPRLAGLHQEYFVGTLTAYTDGKRHSGIMEPIAARLKREEIEEVAEFYTSQPNDSLSETTDSDMDPAIERGKTIAEKGLPKQEVGACVACHRTNRSGHNPSYPVLIGQSADYLTQQLELFQQRHRGGLRAEIMHKIVDGLNAEQIRDVARYYSTLNQQQTQKLSDSASP